MFRWALFAGLFMLMFCLSGSPAMADKTEIKLKDGSTVKGEITQEDQFTYTVKTADGNRQVRRSDISQIDYPSEIADEFAKKRAAIDAKDYDKRYDLANWAHEQYSEAKKNTVALRVAIKELDSIINDNPGHLRASLLKSIIFKKLTDVAKKPDAPMPGVEPMPMPMPGVNPPAAGPKEPGDLPTLLTPEQINLIKVFEVTLDEKPDVQIKDSIAETLFSKYADSPALKDFPEGRRGKAKFERLEPVKQLAVIFEAAARDVYKDIVFRREPRALQTYRTKVHPTLVVRYCGSCHGEPKPAAGFSLLTKKNDEASVYTDFLALSYGEGTSKDVVRPLIDRERPEDSLLLQFALPITKATYPHPTVAGMKPYFNAGTSDPSYRITHEWISKELRKIRPDYHFEYKLPFGPKKITPGAKPATPEAKPEAKPGDKPADKPAEKEAEKPAEKPAN